MFSAVRAHHEGALRRAALTGSPAAQGQVTILSQASYPPGTPVWSASPVAGFFPLQLAQAVPSGTGPDIYSTQLSADGTQTIVQALTASGQQMWQTTALPVANNNSVPDAFGGLLLTLNNTCKSGQTVPMTIRDLDPTGQTLWEFTAQQVPGLGYCYAGAPQMAVRGDGAVAVSSSNASGLPEIMFLDGMQGFETFAPPIPQSCYTQAGGTVVCGYSLIGAPIVDPSGSVFVEYEVRNTAYPPKITSSVLYLLQIVPGNATQTVQLSSTTQDEALLPGRIIPDGQGGILATWTISPSNPPVPQFPYQAADVISGVVGTPYNLPFSPQSVSFGQSPALVLGGNGTVVASGSTTVTINGAPTSVNQIASFNLSSGATNWTYQAGAGSKLSILGVLSDGSIAVNDSVNGGIQLSSSGSATTVTGPVAGIPQYSWGGNWYVQSASGTSGIMLPFAVDPADAWATPTGNSSSNGSSDSLCPCLLQQVHHGRQFNAISQ